MNSLSNLLALLALVALPPAAVLTGILTLTTLSGADADGNAVDGAAGYRVLSYSQERGSLQFDRSVSGSPISLGGRVFARGLGTSANSEIRLVVRGTGTTLSGYCGVDDAARGAGSVVCKVASDRRLLWESRAKGGDAPRFFEVSIAGISRLDLFVEDAGDGAEADFASWADLQVSDGGAP